MLMLFSLFQTNCSRSIPFFERKNNQKINDILSIITGQFPLTNFDAKDKFSDSNNVKWSLDLNVDVDIMFK